jgi:hypothetical protein
MYIIFNININRNGSDEENENLSNIIVIFDIQYSKSVIMQWWRVSLRLCDTFVLKHYKSVPLVLPVMKKRWHCGIHWYGIVCSGGEGGGYRAMPAWRRVKYLWYACQLMTNRGVAAIWRKWRIRCRLFLWPSISLKAEKASQLIHSAIIYGSEMKYNGGWRQWLVAK